jgi:hypothetical protein
VPTPAVAARPELLDVTWHDGDRPQPPTGPDAFALEAHGAPGWALVAAATGPSPADDDARIRYRLGGAHGPAGSFLGSSPYVLSVRAYPPAELRDELVRWLEEEHSERMRRIGGAAWHLWYASTTGRPCVLNLWGLASPGQIETPAWAEGNATEWTRRLQPALAGRDRRVYRLVAGPA